MNHRIQFPLHIHFPFGAQGEAAHTFVETDVGKDRLEVTEAARQYLAEVGYDPHFGAHPLKRAIQRELQDPLALKVLAGEFREGDTIRLGTCGASLETCATGLTFSVGVEVVEGEVVA